MKFPSMKNDTNKASYNELITKLNEVRRLRDVLADVDRNLEQTKADLLQAETQLAIEQASLAPEELRSLTRTPSVKRVKTLSEDLHVLGAQQNGVNQRLRTVVAELPQCSENLRNALANWGYGIAEQAETEYRSDAAVFGKAMVKALAIFNAINAGRQSRAIQHSVVHDFDTFSPMIRMPAKVVDGLDADTAAYVSKLSDWRVACMKAMADAEEAIRSGTA